jgi:BAR domain
MERLQKSMNSYVKWMTRRAEGFEDKEKSLPISYLGQVMVSHGEDFESDSEFGNCLIGTSGSQKHLA